MKAFVFPGQGSQSVGMLSHLADRYSIFADYYDRASHLLGFDMQELVGSDAHQRLNTTEYTQPAILTCSVALWQLWLQQGGARPDFVAGHSLGEYSAAVAADVFGFDDALRLVHQRGKIMQQAVEDGVMIALVGLDDETVIDLCSRICDQLGERAVEPANFNAPGQVVVAGRSHALESVTSLAKQAGAKRAIPLPVSVPSHSTLMKDASETFARHLQTIEVSDASIPLVQNVDARAKTRASEIVAALVEQLHQPVRWTQSVEFLASQGVTELCECGPGKVLTGLTKRINSGITASLLADDGAF